MADEAIKPGDVVEERDVWLAQFRVADGVWQDISTHRENPVEALRLYDYWVTNHTDVELRMTKTRVVTEVFDVEELRKMVDAPNGEADDASG
jgi:hypothetical protein